MKIIETRHWNAENVRHVCRHEELYMNGTVDEYRSMLNYVRDHLEPTLDDIYHVAEDINRHSEGQTVTNIMYMLSNGVVHRCYDIEE